MTKRIGTARRKTRHVMSIAKKQKGKLAISKVVQQLRPGDKVVLSIAPSVHHGAYYRRFHGRTGSVSGKKGSCYEVIVKDMNVLKKVIVNPVHLTKAKLAEQSEGKSRTQ